MVIFKQTCFIETKGLELDGVALEVRAKNSVGKKPNNGNSVPEACKDNKKKIKDTMKRCGMKLGKKKPSGGNNKKTSGGKKNNSKNNQNNKGGKKN